MNSLLVGCFGLLSLVSLVSSQSTSSSLYCLYAGECGGLISSYNNSYIYCYGDASCAGSQLSVTNTIWSSGNEATKDSKLLADSSVYCYGPDSCMNSEIYTNQLQCWSIQSCAQTESYNVTTAYYIGYQSGIGSHIIHSNIYSSYSSIYGYATNSLKYALIRNARTVYGFADSAYDNADIVADGISEMTVQAYGSNSFRGANVYCTSGVHCQFVCENTGCKRLTIYILTGSTYEIIHQYDNCNDLPTIIESNSTDNDLLILDMYEKRRYIKSLVKKDVKNIIMNDKTTDEDNTDIGDLWDDLFNKYANELKLYENEDKITSKLNIKINVEGELAGNSNKGVKLKFLYVLLGSVIMGVLFSIAAIMLTLVKYISTYIGDNNNNNGYDEIKSGKTYNIFNGFKYQSI